MDSRECEERPSGARERVKWRFRETFGVDLRRNADATVSYAMLCANVGRVRTMGKAVEKETRGEEEEEKIRGKK